MKLALVVPGGISLLLGFACSSPAPEPARAAASAAIGPNGSASQCVMTGPTQEIPGTALNGEVTHQVTCDPSQAGCNPTAIMMEDGKGGATVQCTVKPSGSGFDVTLNADAPGIMSFSGSGVLTTGTSTNFHVFVTNHVKANTGSDSTCSVVAKSIGAGKVLATYDCLKFDVGGIAGDPGCHATGGFVFDRCDH